MWLIHHIIKRYRTGLLRASLVTQVHMNDAYENGGTAAPPVGELTNQDGTAVETPFTEMPYEQQVCAQPNYLAYLPVSYPTVLRISILLQSNLSL